MSQVGAIAVLRRDRWIILAGLVAVASLAWGYTIYLAGNMQKIDMTMPHMQAWGVVDFVLMFVMWWVMMVAMMTPSASPMIFMFATINRKRREQDKPFVSTMIFLFGYLIAWGMYSAVATILQWLLQTTALVSPMMASTSPVLGGTLLIAAGIFQLTPLKHACMKHCRTPMGFLMTEWRDGSRGALVMGLRHGYYCLGCCWILMALLFIFGVMNLVWVAVLAAFILVEKVATTGERIGRVGGVLLIFWGIWMFFAPA